MYKAVSTSYKYVKVCVPTNKVGGKINYES